MIFFASNMLEEQGDSLEGKTCLVSGSGNVAQYAMQKILQLGGKPLTCSDSSGYVFDEEGIDFEKLEFIKDLKNVRRGRIGEFADKYSSATFFPAEKGSDHNPLWNHSADCAFPCATQNEANAKDAENMVRNGIKLVAEGANMPITHEGISVLHDGGVLYAPGKASNAGGVATSGLEMAQNYYGMKWKAEQVEDQLRQIMKNIHDSCLKAANKYGLENNYQAGANIAGFRKVADAMLDQGVI